MHHRREPETHDERESCPFCEGREQRTPPETFAVAAGDRRPDTPGWAVRVVPNLYPAFEQHEVVVHTPRHARSFGDLDGGEVEAVAAAWKARADVARGAGFALVQAVINEGREAGGSLAHSHSQLVWLKEEPPLVASERRAACGICAAVQEARDHDLVVGWREEIELSCPWASRAPYEMLIAPSEGHDPDAFLDEEELALGLQLLADGVRWLHAIEGPVPLNAWLHTAPFGEDGHWHIEVVPRLSVIASLELGAGIYINSLPPEEAAKRLRAAPDSHREAERFPAQP